MRTIIAALALTGAIANTSMLPNLANAGESDVIAAKATKSGAGWRFDVTVRHADTGWEHYADAWRVVGPDGTVYGTRTLYHPHVDEQPFTRSLSGVAIPAGVTQVAVESHDSVHGWGGAKVSVTLQ
ncbi:MAG: hypothetical protein AAGJ28_11415 [Pseudomonadota bacterium]